MALCQMTLVDRQRIARDTMAFWFDTNGASFEFRAGQHAVIRPAVFLAGGMGIAPIRSILHWATRERLPHRLYLFYSNRQVVDAAFIKEFETMTAQNPNFTFISTFTR